VEPPTEPPPGQQPERRSTRAQARTGQAPIKTPDARQRPTRGKKAPARPRVVSAERQVFLSRTTVRNCKATRNSINTAGAIAPRRSYASASVTQVPLVVYFFILAGPRWVCLTLRAKKPSSSSLRKSVNSSLMTSLLLPSTAVAPEPISCWRLDLNVVIVLKEHGSRCCRSSSAHSGLA